MRRGAKTMKERKVENILNIFKEDDSVFNEKVMTELSDKELTRFLEENPDFLKDLD